MENKLNERALNAILKLLKDKKVYKSAAEIIDIVWVSVTRMDDLSSQDLPIMSFDAEVKLRSTDSETKGIYECVYKFSGSADIEDNKVVNLSSIPYKITKV